MSSQATDRVAADQGGDHSQPDARQPLAEAGPAGGTADGAPSFWAQIGRNVWGDHAVIQPFGAWLLTALFGLVAWLTIAYAPHAFIEAGADAGATGRGVIPVEAGRATVLVVALIAFLAALYPGFRRWRARRGRLGAPTSTLGRAFDLFYRAPSGFWSALDMVFAIPLAILAGAAWRSRLARYLHGGALILGAIMLGLYAPPEIGLPAVLIGAALIVAVTRRWSWVERDRERFMIERRKRKGAELVGLRQDLTDEALLGLIFLFVLIPLGLAQIQAWTAAAGAPAFGFKGDYALPEDELWALWAWLGFFGAELAKAVPFVDWSEVFRVENDSPIDAATPFGAQIIFLTRASLDLILLASVLQAVQIAGRLQAQRESFDAQELPIVEPFEEALRFEQAVAAMPDGIELQPNEQPALDVLRHYDRERLEQLVANETGEADPQSRKLAAALLVRRCFEDEDAAPGIDRFFTAAIAAEQSEAMKHWLARAACLAEPAPASAAARAALPDLLKSEDADWRARAAAARALGRGAGALSGEAADLLTAIAGAASEPKLRADAALALAKRGVATAEPALVSLVDGLGRAEPPVGAHREALIAAAHGLALLGHPREAVLGRVKTGEKARLLAERGWRIQARPMTSEAATTRETGEALDQLVALTPGRGEHPPSFMMGAEKPEGVFYPEQREVEMTLAFALGRYSVTNEEWRGFRLTFDRAEAAFLELNSVQEASVLRWPALEVSWRDAALYCAWLSRVTGERWRLPREAEWEYACRAGSTTVFAWGDDEATPALANYQGTRNRPIPVEGEGQEGGGAFCNAWGLWQMHGNAVEWCQDPWEEDASSGPRRSSDAWLSGDTSQAVIRGGSWGSSPPSLRSANRVRYPRVDRSSVIGFRVARTHVE